MDQKQEEQEKLSDQCKNCEKQKNKCESCPKRDSKQKHCSECPCLACKYSY